MVGSRALLAFQFQERDAAGNPSDDAELGALLTAEFQGAVVRVLSGKKA